MVRQFSHDKDLSVSSINEHKLSIYPTNEHNSSISRTNKYDSSISSANEHNSLVFPLIVYENAQPSYRKLDGNWLCEYVGYPIFAITQEREKLQIAFHDLWLSALNIQSESPKWK